MSAIIDLLVTQTDPITAIVLVGMWYQMRAMRADLKEDMQANKQRISRLEEGVMNE